MKYIPLYDRILIKKINDENKIGGIFVPNTENNLIKGEVIEAGIGKLLNDGNIKPLIVKKNDVILFKDNYNSEKYKIENIDFYFIKESDIISIIKQ